MIGSRGRRSSTFALLLAGSLAVAACGDSTADEPLTDGSTGTAVETADDASADGTDDTGSDPTGTDDTSGATTDDDVGTATPAGGSTPADPDTGKPSVDLPDELPTELVITDLVEGDGEPAEAGDTVELYFVGVVSADGAEFGSNYGTENPITVSIGAPTGIEGLDEGLLGVRAGMLRQLDIPAALAFGDAGDGDIIGPGAAITMLLDIITVDKRVPPTIPPQADPSECPAVDGSEAQQREFAEYPPFCIDADTTYTATIVTNFGEFTIELDQRRAPLTVNSFVTLARYHYFDDTECHRAIPGFVVQCGDPTATGSGGPGYEMPDELPLAGEYEIGSIAMANAGADTGGSQFFIITGPDGAALPPSYSLFGQVVDGLDSTVAALDAVANPENNGVPPLEQILIESVTITET